MGRILHGVGGWKTQSMKASTSDVCYFNGSGFVTGAALINQVFHPPTLCKNRPTFFLQPAFCLQIAEKKQKTCIIKAALSFEWVRLKLTTHGYCAALINQVFHPPTPCKNRPNRPNLSRLSPVQFYTRPFYRLFFVLGQNSSKVHHLCFGCHFTVYGGFDWFIFFTPKL